MKPYLIVSDIHANLEALEAVLADAAGRYDEILCLGDLVDYGADPNAVVDWARANVCAIVRGNHESEPDPRKNFNPQAARSALWTRAHLTPDNSAYVEAMPAGPLRVGDFDLVHGSPKHEDDYIVGIWGAQIAFPSARVPVTFFGHTHHQGGFELVPDAHTILPMRRIVKLNHRTVKLNPLHFYLINPGSVGQPRDDDPRAAYALYSPAKHTVEFRRVEYDIQKTAAKIRKAGLPASHAARLFNGR